MKNSQTLFGCFSVYRKCRQNISKTTLVFSSRLQYAVSYLCMPVTGAVGSHRFDRFNFNDTSTFNVQFLYSNFIQIKIFETWRIFTCYLRFMSLVQLQHFPFSWKKPHLTCLAFPARMQFSKTAIALSHHNNNKSAYHYLTLAVEHETWSI